MTPILISLLKAKKFIFATFVAVFAVLLVLLAFRHEKYEAHMSFLVRNERAQSLVNADPTQNSVQPDDLTEERINSEVAMLSSAEILQAVVVDQGLQKEFLNSNGSNQAAAVERATRKLSKTLVVLAVRKSNVIEVTYTSSDRYQAKNVLDSLSRMYLRDYARLHSARGASEFYNEKLHTIEAALRNAQSSRAKLLGQNGYMLLPEGQTLGLQDLVNLQKLRNEVKASLSETESRLADVRAQQRVNSPRLITQRKISANQMSVEQIDVKLVDLRNRLTELRMKFVDTDPLVKQTEQQIADTKTELNSAQELRSEDITSDINPVRQELDGQANLLSQTRAGLLSRLKTLDLEMRGGENKLSETEQASIAVDGLNRDIKVLQDSSDFYHGKFLAATAAEEMDSEKFGNVVEATHPTVPVLPVASHFNVWTSFLLALFVALGAGLASTRRNLGAGSKVIAPATIQAPSAF
jgi:uncharacterized protein involved in exopolysaccharide biosynthesis